jgi:hypothetical protein
MYCRQEGFRIGFQHQAQGCESAKRNRKSAKDNPREENKYLEKEVRMGRVIGPSDPQELLSPTPGQGPIGLPVTCHESSP